MDRLKSQKEQKFYNQLRRGGKWLYRHGIISYDELFDELEFCWMYWNITRKIICVFKGHKAEQFYRLPKEGETPLLDMCGCVKDDILCKRCWKTLEENDIST